MSLTICFNIWHGGHIYQVQSNDGDSIWHMPHDLQILVSYSKGGQTLELVIRHAGAVMAISSPGYVRYLRSDYIILCLYEK